MKTVEKEYERLAVGIYLSKYMKQDLKDDGDNAGNGCNNRAGTDHSLSPVDFLESAIVYYHPSFIGYLEAVIRLLQQAFFRKKRKDFFLIGRMVKVSTE